MIGFIIDHLLDIYLIGGIVCSILSMGATVFMCLLQIVYSCWQWIDDKDASDAFFTLKGENTQNWYWDSDAVSCIWGSIWRGALCVVGSWLWPLLIFVVPAAIMYVLRAVRRWQKAPYNRAEKLKSKIEERNPQYK